LPSHGVEKETKHLDELPSSVHNDQATVLHPMQHRISSLLLLGLLKARLQMETFPIVLSLQCIVQAMMEHVQFMLQLEFENFTQVAEMRLDL
jgi:hypothetical protein